jgi:hypothetical protein
VAVEPIRVNRSLPFVFAMTALLYLPAVRYGYVQDDRAIVAANPAAHSIGAAVRAFDQPYWPLPSEAGLYRPLTILSLAVDWSLAGGRPWWPHMVNALWHGLASVLLVLILARWLPPLASVAAGLVFAVHPVHVEGVANIVSRNELLAGVGIFAAVLAARQHWWIVTVVCAGLAMLSKENAIVVGGLILLDDWLRPGGQPAYPRRVYGALGIVTIAFLVVWMQVGKSATADVAAPFLGAGLGQRLAMALPALARATALLFWPVSLSVDYSPQVIPYRTSISFAAILGAGIALLVLWSGFAARRRAPALCFAALGTALAYLPTSNLLFPVGVVLAERNLYLAVLLPATLAGLGVAWALERWERPPVLVPIALLLGALAARTLYRLPAWTDNRALLLTLLTDHPESYRGQQSAAAVFAGMGGTADARAAYARADSLFGRDPHLQAAYAYYLVGMGDTIKAAPLAREARHRLPRERVAMRVEYLLAKVRREPERARALKDSALRWFPFERAWYDATALPPDP